MSQYRNKVTLLSFALSVLVIIRHGVNIEVYQLESGILYWIQMFFREFSDIAVPTFFMLSGFLFFQNYNSKLLLTKWKSRLFSILIPYLVWNVIAYLYYEAIAVLPFVRASLSQTLEPFNLEWLIRNALWGEHNITWFLRNIIVYVLVVPMLFPVLKHRAGSWILVAATILAGMWNPSLYGFVYNSAFYLVGAWFGIHQRNFVQQRYAARIRILAAAFLLVTILLNLCFAFGNDLLRVPLRTLQAIALWIAADVLATEKTPFWWLRISFVIYCSHSFILESVEKLFLILLKKTLLGATMDFLFAPVITLCIILAVSAVLRKVKPVWRLLSGNR